MSAVSLRSPELKAGWPQHVWFSGTSTLQPASSRSFTVAKPTEGRNRSTRQVTKRPTRGRVNSIRCTLQMVGKTYGAVQPCPASSYMTNRLSIRPQCGTKAHGFYALARQG